MDTRPVSIDDLLANAGWVHALARSLLRDPHAADDAAQQAFTDALERPPRRGNLRAWFARVVRHKVADDRRAAARRRRHEAAAPVREGTLSPDELLARAELRAQLAEAVLGLGEPYRSALLLRWYEGLDPARIAALQSVPIATVRTRLQRGLALLRERLDTAWGNDPKATRARLLALTSGGWGALATGGALVFTKKTSAAIVVAATLLLASGAWWLLHEPRGNADEASGSELASAAPEGASGPSLAGRGTGVLGSAEGAAGSSAMRADGLLVYPALAREEGRLDGSVHDLHGGPAAGARVEVRSSAGAQFPLLRIGDERDHRRVVETDPQGRFSVAGLAGGPYWVRARRGREGTPWTLAVARAAPFRMELGFQHDELPDLAVRVVDASGSPVTGATVHAEGSSSGLAPLEPDAIRVSRSGTTDGGGRVAWDDFAPHEVLVLARARAGLVGAKMLYNRSDAFRERREEQDLEVVVAEPGRIVGRVTMARGEPAEGASVVARAAAPHWYPYWTTVSTAWRTPVVDGRYELTGLPAGPYELLVEGGDWFVVVEWQDAERRMPTPRLVHVTAAGEVSADLTVTRGATIEGIVLGPGGVLPGAWVRAAGSTHFDPRSAFHLAGAHVWRLYAAHRSLLETGISHRTAVADAAGRYRIGGLAPGTYRVEFGAPGHTFVQHQAQSVSLAQPLRLDARLVRAGVVQGAAPGVEYLGVRRAGETRCAVVANLPASGLFTFPGLVPGDHELVSVHWEREAVVLARVHVVVGRTTWLDLPNAGRSEARGRLLVGGAPLAGANVRRLTPHEGAQADADGRFELRWEQFDFQPTGSLRVSRATGHFQTWTVKGLPMNDDVTDLGDIELGGERLVLDVVDAHGRGIAATVELRSTSSQLPTGVHVATTAFPRTDERGRAVVEGLRRGEVYRLHLPLPSVRLIPTDVKVLDEQHARLTLPVTERLTVVVRDARGNPVAGAAVQGLVTPLDGGGLAERGARERAFYRDEPVHYVGGSTDRAGRFECPTVPVGTIDLQATRPGRHPWDTPTEAARMSVTLAAGQPQEVELRLP